MINKWNATVQEKDLVIHLGDFALHKESDQVGEICKQLKGRKILVRGNHDRKCMSKNTRLLTQKGYKYYWELRKGDLIPTVNLKINLIEYKPIKEIYTYQNEPYIYIAKTQKGEMELTNHHVIIYASGSQGKITKWSKNIVENIWTHKTSFKVPTCFPTDIEDYNIDNDWLSLLAWIVTDGGIDKNKYIVLYQSKQQRIIEIKNLLSKLQIKYTLSKRGRNISNICGKKLKQKPMISYEFHLLAQNSKFILNKLQLLNKYILPSWIWKLSDQQVEFFIFELLKGDGHINKKGVKVLWGRKEFLEQIMGLCVTHNISVTLSKQTGTTNYYLCIRRKCKNRQFDIRHRYIKEYNDIVWCVNVENNTLFVELNGNPFVTGNSIHWYLHNGFDFVCDSFNIGDILFTHRPKPISDFMLMPYKLNIHGHLHEKNSLNDNLYENVSVERTNYYPINLDSIIGKHGLKLKRKNKQGD